MAYSKHIWTKGEIIEADNLNRIENGVADADSNISAVSNDLSKVGIEYSYNVVGREPFVFGYNGAPTVASVGNGYKVTYNTGLESGACYFKISILSDITPFRGKKLTISFDAVCGSGNNTGSTQRVAMYRDNTSLKAVSFTSSGHYYGTSAIIPDNATGAINVYIYPDTRNSNRSNPNEVTVTNLMISEGSSDMPYAPTYTAIDYVARAQISELQAALVELASVMEG